MAHLMYSANEELITRDQLIDIPTPAAQGRFHNPYPFADYVEQIHHALDVNGLVGNDDEYAISHDGQRIFGMMQVQPKVVEGELIQAKDWNLFLGLRGSHDQSIARGITLGSQVIVCSNLCFDGNLGTFNTKQTTNIGSRLPGLIRGAVARVPEVAEVMEHRYEAYRNLVLKPRWGDAALVEIHRRGGLSSAQLGRAIAEWDRPKHEEHAEQGYTGWRLMNACTEALKPTGQNTNMNLVQDRSVIVSGFIDEVAGL